MIHAEVHTIGHIFIWGTKLRKDLWYSWTEVASPCWRHFRRLLALPIVYSTDSKLFPKWEEHVGRAWHRLGQSSLVCRAGHSSPLTAIPGPGPGQHCSPWPSCLAPVKHHGQKCHWCCRGRGLVVHSGSHNQMCAGFQTHHFCPASFPAVSGL